MATTAERIKNQDSRFAHNCTSPFPMKTRDGRFVVNERCQCGAKRSEHQDTFQYGHGACPPTSCAKFRFKDFIFATDVQQKALERGT